MRAFARRYRALPRSLLRRLDRVAGLINPVLTIIAIGLAMLDLLFAIQKLVDSLPPAAQFGMRGPC
jgi:hypothetical protein